MENKYNFKSEIEANIGICWALNCVVAEWAGDGNSRGLINGGKWNDEFLKKRAYAYLDLREQMKGEIRLANMPKGKSKAERSEDSLNSAELDSGNQAEGINDF